MDHFFPLNTVKKKSVDLPLLNDTAKKMIKRKKGIFTSESRSSRWRRARYNLDRYQDKRKQIFLQIQRDKFTDTEASKNFFRNVKSFNCAEKSKSSDISDLDPEKTDSQVAEKVNCFFHEISYEFSPLQLQDIPLTYDRPLPHLSEEIVAKKIYK